MTNKRCPHGLRLFVIFYIKKALERWREGLNPNFRFMMKSLKKLLTIQ